MVRRRRGGVWEFTSAERSQKCHFKRQGPGGASGRQRMTQRSVATHPELCLETLRQLATTGGSQWEQLNRALFSPAKRRKRGENRETQRSRKCLNDNSGPS